MRMEFLWLALIVVFAVIEGATTALTTVWFIGGALAALAAALLHAELWLQITLFFAVSVVLLAALRPPRQPEGAGAGLSPAARYHEG